MVTCANSDTQTIEQGTHIQVVDIAYVEAHYGVFQRSVSRTINLHSIDSHQLLHAIASELLLVLLYELKANGINIFYCFCQSVSGYVVGGSCLELKWQTLTDWPKL